MNYNINYNIQNILRDMKLEELLEEVNQHILKKYKLCSGHKSIKDENYNISMDNNQLPIVFDFSKNYQKINK